MKLTNVMSNHKANGTVLLTFLISVHSFATPQEMIGGIRIEEDGSTNDHGLTVEFTDGGSVTPAIDSNAAFTSSEPLTNWFWAQNASSISEIQMILTKDNNLFIPDPNASGGFVPQIWLDPTVPEIKVGFKKVLTYANSGSGISFSGTFNSSETGTNIPETGAGTRMMWYPEFAAFRVGTVSNDAWDFTYLGINSSAFGYDVVASGDYAIAAGYSAEVFADYGFASGNNSYVASTATGGAAFNQLTTANGVSSTAMGQNTTSDAYASLAIGRYNVGTGSNDTWVATDPIFEVGIGSDSQNPANAVTVLKNGNVGIGEAAPGDRLVISGGNLKVTGNGAIILENQAGDIPMWGAAQ